MVIRFSGIVQRVGEEEAIIGIVPVAGISTIRVDDSTRISGKDSGTATLQAIRPGTRIRISGLDDGGDQIRAQQLTIVAEAGDGASSLPASRSSAPSSQPPVDAPARSQMTWGWLPLYGKNRIPVERRSVQSR